MRVLVDPGHGMGNRVSGVFDPGAVTADGVREADLALGYALVLRTELLRKGAAVELTRYGSQVPCSLASRVRLARQWPADLLLSVHFNADDIPGDSPPDGRAKGLEVLWRTPGSEKFAQAVRDALSISHRPVRGAIRAGSIYVLSYDPSVLVEFGFIDDPEDFAMISAPEWRRDTCSAVVAAVLDASREVRS